MEEGILCRFTFVKCMMIMMTKRVMIIKTLMPFSRIMKFCQIKPDYYQAISLHCKKSDFLFVKSTGAK